MHEILRFLADGVTGPAPIPSAPDQSVKIAIITAISVVIAAAFTAISATFTKRHNSDHPHATDQDYMDELVRRAEVAERRSNRLEQQRDLLTERVDELERYLWRAGVDPNTGDAVTHLRPERG